MPSFKSPTFQERAALAAKAKEAALERIRNKVPIEQATLTAREAARIAREAAQEKKRHEKRTALEHAKAEREARAIERRELEASVPILTDTEKKAARDARYAKRKSRNTNS